MENNFAGKLRAFFFSGMLCALFFMVSCSNSSPEILSIEKSLIISYRNAESLPELRLSVYGECSSDVRRVDEIRLRSVDENLLWVCENPSKIGSGSKYWAGYSDFVSASDSVFPQGKYIFSVENADGQFCESEFRLKYSQDLVGLNAGDAVEEISRRSVKKIAIYNVDDILLYYDLLPENWTDNYAVKSDYGTASKIRICYELNGERTVVMLPEMDFVNREEF